MISLLSVALGMYCLSSMLYLAHMHIKIKYLAAYGTLFAVAGFIMQSAQVAINIQSGVGLSTSAYDAMLFLSWSIALIYLVLLAKYKLPAMGGLAMPLSLVALAFAFKFSAHGSPLAGGIWLRIHVGLIVISFAMFVLAFCSAVFYLVQNSLLKAKRLNFMFRKLPPLETIDSVGYYLTAIGFPLLTLGVITAIVGVESSKLHTSSSVLKLATAIASWVVYGTYLGARGAFGWRGKKSNWILILGSVLIVVTTALHKFALAR